MNRGRLSFNTSTSNSPLSRQKSPKMKDFLIEYARRHEDDLELKSVFEQLAYELRNIEHCLNFQIELSSNHKQVRTSKIITHDKSF